MRLGGYRGLWTTAKERRLSLSGNAYQLYSTDGAQSRVLKKSAKDARWLWKVARRECALRIRSYDYHDFNDEMPPRCHFLWPDMCM